MFIICYKGRLCLLCVVGRESTIFFIITCFPLKLKGMGLNGWVGLTSEKKIKIKKQPWTASQQDSPTSIVRVFTPSCYRPPTMCPLPVHRCDCQCVVATGLPVPFPVIGDKVICSLPLFITVHTTPPLWAGSQPCQQNTHLSHHITLFSD